MRQTSIFDIPSVNSLVTRRAAAISVRPTAGRLRARVLAFIVSQNEHGASDEEAQLALGMQGNTQRPRRRELQASGLILDSGIVRTTSAGRCATVWIATAAGVSAHKAATAIVASRPEPPTGISAPSSAAAGVCERKPPRDIAGPGRDAADTAAPIDAAGDGLARWEQDDQADAAAAEKMR